MYNQVDSWKFRVLYYNYNLVGKLNQFVSNPTNDLLIRSILTKLFFVYKKYTCSSKLGI